ncbi:uncharacterized protein K02A2.6-like [Armigeres subalbatus]|uniref:uncharacterized protein K02A2.6-like n=1 Tax=Armigeres subalbatus TaxID=124917 RepID=UPI002ED49010
MNPEFSLLDILQNQQRILDKLMENQSSAGQDNGSSSSRQSTFSNQRNNNQEFIIESLSSGITEFMYDPENGVTFAAWFSRYEDLFHEDAKNLDEAAKVRLLLRNIGTVAHQKYISYFLPKKPNDQNFDQTVSILKTIFGRQILVFNARYQCLQLSKNSSDDFYTYAGIVNQKCEEFKLNEVTPDQFKCLMYVCGLKSHRDADIRTTLLSRIESNKPDDDMTVHRLVDECQRLINLKRDTAMVEKHSSTEQALWDVPINAVCNTVQLQKFPRTEGLIQELQHKYDAIFSDELGLCKKKKVSFTVKPGIKPIFRLKRPVPYASASKIEVELDRLQKLGIIIPVSYSEWAAPIVAVTKPNGRVRICADYSTGLNSALEPHQHPLPLPQDIFAKLANKKVFSQIDLSDAYLQVEIDQDSRKRLTINTHKGLFEFTRLSPGVKTAPGAFQEIVDNMIAGLDGVSGYLDDIIVASDSVEEHMIHLERLFARIREYGFTLKIEKSNFFMSEIKYLGLIVDSQGIRPDPEKVRAISEMSAPHDVTTLRSFLGAVNYYSKFVRGMHKLREPMDALLKKDVRWYWSPACQQSFNQFKRILQSNLLLTHYDPRLEIIVAADASMSGVGAVLLHRFPDGTIKAVCHVSRTMTQAENGYSQDRS